MRQFRAYVRQFGRFQRNSRLYLLQSALSGIAIGVFTLLYPLYLSALGYKIDLIGLVLFFMALGTGVGIIPAGFCVDRFSGKAILIWSSVMIVIAVLGQILCRDLIPLCISTLVVGIGVAFQYVLNAPFLLMNSTDDERPHLFSINIVFTLATAVIGQVVGGALPFWLHPYSWAMLPDLSWLLAVQPLARSYQIALLCGVLIALTSFVPLLLMTAVHPTYCRLEQQSLWLVLLLPRKIWHALRKRFKRDAGTKLDVTAKATTLSSWQRLGQFLFSPLAIMTATYVLTGLGTGLIYPYFGLFFVEHLGTNSAFFGVISGSSNALLAFATLLAPWLVMRIGSLKTIVLTSFIGLPFILCMGLLPSLLLVTILYLCFQVFWNMANGVVQLFGMEVVPPKLQGRANSSYQVAFQATSAAATPIGGLLIAHLGYTPVLCMTTVLFLLTEILLWWRFTGKRFVASDFLSVTTQVEDPL